MLIPNLNELANSYLSYAKLISTILDSILLFLATKLATYKNNLSLLPFSFL